ncbi:hypothetical protein LUZ62_047012 [Rhynchospora pubera]|uniref:Metalloenzyme domain-containing protein n=1 Tax=Rhynchospora pubera TaxID=906938 RepID=A0AAV8FXC8_9POAL|nr:hypothetical protein LUZ62_047012 [Rhynchospora pubera]
MVAPTKIIAGLGLSLGIDILEAPGATGDYRTLLTSKAKSIASALTAPSQPPPRVFVPGEEEFKPGRVEGYDFGFLHIKAIDDAAILKVRGLEAVGQLTKLLWQAEASGSFQYYLCVTGDHSTPVEYGDHSFEPVPFALCRLGDFVGAVGEENLDVVSLEDFPLPSVAAGEDLAEVVQITEVKFSPGTLVSYFGDSVSEFNEIAAARGCLGRFPGSEMMGGIKKYMKTKYE